MWRAHLRVSPNLRVFITSPVLGLDGWWGSEGVAASNVPTVETEQDAVIVSDADDTSVVAPAVNIALVNMSMSCQLRQKS